MPAERAGEESQWCAAHWFVLRTESEIWVTTVRTPKSTATWLGVLSNKSGHFGRIILSRP